ncbi:MAG: SpoIIE family protein phosphatase [bacterium]
MARSAGKTYQFLLATISTVGWGLLAFRLSQLHGDQPWGLMLMLLIANAWANYLKIQFGAVLVNQSFAFHLLGVLLLGPTRAAGIGVLAYLMGIGWPERHVWWRNIVNCAIIGMSVLAMGACYDLFGGYRIDSMVPMGWWDLIPVVLAGLTHLVVNTLLLYSLVLSRPSPAPPTKGTVLRTIWWDLIAKFVYAPLAFYIYLAYGGNAQQHQVYLVGPLLFMLFIWLLLKSTMELNTTKVELSERNAILKQLHEFTFDANDSLDLNAVLRTALRRCATLAHSRHSAIFLLDPLTKEAYLAFHESDDRRWRDYLQSGEMEQLVDNLSPAGLRRDPSVPGAGNDPLRHPVDPVAKALGIEQLLAFTLFDKDSAAGALILALPEGSTPSDASLQILRIISMEVAQAFRNAGVYDDLKREMARREDELALAAKIQRRILPDNLEMPGVKATTHFRPARSVGGDYYDLIAIDATRLAVVIGDVSGKGIPAAMTMMSLVNGVKVWTNSFRAPERILELMNKALCEGHKANDEVLQYSTAIMGIYDTVSRRFTYSIAGHERPLLLHHDRLEPEIQPGDGYPLGLFTDSQYFSRTITLEPGDRLVLYTDGFPDMRNPAGDRLTREGFVQFLTQAHEIGGPDFTPYLVQRLREYSGMTDNLADDQALVILEVTDEAVRPDLPPVQQRESQSASMLPAVC